MTTATSERSNTLDFDFNSLPRIGNGFLDRLNAIREAEPVFWSDYQRGWLVTRHADVVAGFRGEVPLSAQRLVEANLGSIPPEEWLEKLPLLVKQVDWIINSDPPSHTRMRTLMGRAFGRKTVEAVRPFVQSNIDALLDEVEGGEAVEFNEKIARVITGKTILRLLGIPMDYLPQLKDWAAAVTNAGAAVSPSAELLINAEKALAEMYDLFRIEIEKRRVSPQEDVFTGLVQAVDGGDKLTMDEMLGSSIVLLLAGHDTTLNSMTLGVETLSRHSEHRMWIAENPDKGETAVIELMRYFAMSTGMTRKAKEDFEWHGKSIRKGDLVYLMIAGANRDPRAFENPEVLDFARNNSEAMTFAPGIHHCIGHLLGKMQLGEFFSRAYSRFKQIEVTEPHITYAQPFVFRGIPSMHVRFHRNI